jgi:hypothetical protein
MTKILITYEELDNYFINNGLDSYDEDILDEEVVVDIKLIKNSEGTIDIMWECEDMDMKGIIYDTNDEAIINLINFREYISESESESECDDDDDDDDDDDYEYNESESESESEGESEGESERTLSP